MWKLTFKNNFEDVMSVILIISERSFQNVFYIFQKALSIIYLIRDVKKLVSEDIICVSQNLFQKTFYEIHFMNFGKLIPKILFWKSDCGNFVPKNCLKNFISKILKVLFQNVFTIYTLEITFHFENLWECTNKLWECTIWIKGGKH